MLDAVFSFRGRINRIQYFLGGLGLAFTVTVIAVVAIVGLVGARGVAGIMQAMLPLALVALVVGPVYLWVAFSLQARRFRDMGWNPLYVIPGWIVAEVAVRIATFGAASLMMDGLVVTMVINLFMSACLLFWPGQADAGSTPPTKTTRTPPPRPLPRTTVATAGQDLNAARSGFGRRGL